MKKSLIPTLVVMLTLLFAGTGYANQGQFVADAPTETPAGDSFRPVYLQQLSDMREKLQEAKEAEALEHQVVRGETLGAIAKQYGTSVEYLMGINDLRNPDFIREGQILTLLVESPSSDVALVGATHTLRPGDTVWVLAKHYKVSVEAIMAANKISDPHRLTTGEQLVIPGATTTTTPQQTQPQRVVASRSTSRSEAGFIWPSPGYISSGYGPRWGSFHYGLDIAAVTGTPIVAIASGVVTSAGWRSGYGYMVRIDHKNGWESVYAHASKLFVKSGQEVASGQRIASVGQTGNATGPHVHLETIFNGEHQNPIRNLPDR
jgi:murein DD-endopeptidase MepM/ murein hydrolase activator NlpD